MEAWFGSETAPTNDWKKRTAFRLLGCCPQIIGAAFVSDLDVIANYAGLFTTLSYSVCPSLLSIYSVRALRKIKVSPDTAYKTPFSKDWVAWMIFTTAIVVMLFVVISSVLVESGEKTET
eukprot:14649204-Ditylum_brightwellii.AAC.1